MTGTKMMLNVEGEKFVHMEAADQHWHDAWRAHQKGDTAERNRLLGIAADHYGKAGIASMVGECEDVISGASFLHS
jgi:hypothetical protein